MTDTARPTSREYRRLRNMLIGISALIAVSIGFVAWDSDRDGTQAEAERQARTVASCYQYNDGVERAVEGARAEADELVNQSDASRAAEGERPVDQGTRERYVAAQVARSRQVNRTRDCSPAGIDAYFSQPPAKLDCEPDKAKPGYCATATTTTP